MRANIGVIFGGKSVEHEISIISACEIMGYIDDTKYNVIPIYIDKDNVWYTGMHLKDIINYRDIALVKRYAKKVALIRDGKRVVLQSVGGLIKRDLYVIDMVLPIGHGTYMEDGNLQGYLSMLGVPYVGSSTQASSVGQDKVFMKQILAANNIPITDYIWFTEKDYNTNKKKILESLDKFTYPMYVKPANLGSSIGITKVENPQDLTNAIKEAFKYDHKILIEEAVSDVKEVNVSVLGNYEKYDVSEIEEINTNSDFYSFKEKYVNGYSKTCTNEKKSKPLISKEMIEDIKKYAVATFKAIDASGVSRIDFLIDTKNMKIYVSEINTIPGSLSGYLWLAKKMPQKELIDNLFKIAKYEHELKDKIVYSFMPNLLENFDNLNGSKTKKGN